jgi:hypothetical protein
LFRNPVSASGFEGFGGYDCPRRSWPTTVVQTLASLFCALLLGLLALACKSSSNSQVDGGEGGVDVPCPPQASSTSGDAAQLMSGKGIYNKICYEGTSNWYYINVPSGSTLLDITGGYSSAVNTSVNLDIKVYYKSNGTTLTQLQELVASNGADAGGGSSIQTTIHAVQPGDYYIQASDQSNMNFDMTNAYSLDVDYAVDPDTHEPNDTFMDAKVSDSKPGWLAYLGDLDIFKTQANAGDLLTLSITNPLSASASIQYEIASSSGMTLYSNTAPQSNEPFNTTLAVTETGTYYVTLSYPTGAIPSHAQSSAYTFSFGSRTNPDTINNHSLTTAMCPGGGSGPCSMSFSGSDVKLPSVSSYITVPGQRDFYRIDVASGAALVLGVTLTASASTPVKYAVDILAQDPNSPCTANSQCEAMNSTCDYSINDAGVATTLQCELSHACLPPANYHFCPGTSNCSLCQGAGLCDPTNVCLVPEFLSAFSPSGKKIGGPTVKTAQPLFTNGTYYINVHDDSYANVDLSHPYTLTLEMAPEQDQYDQSSDPSKRNNFYEPYPNNMIDQHPNEKLAVPITLGTQVNGWISYASDSDWFSFQHPCPGMNCALDFEWNQPGPSPVDVAFFVLNEDLTQHEAFAYVGDPTKLTAPSHGSFNNQSCEECSFASDTEGDGGPYTYYIRIAAVDPTTWDYTSGGEYNFTLTKGADGCPAACSMATDPATCRCYCASTMSCPSPKF